MPVMTAPELAAFMAREFPQSRPDGFQIEEVRDMYLRARCRTGEESLRPGGTVAGPVMMELADQVM